jgi:hypothetical protein
MDVVRKRQVDVVLGWKFDRLRGRQSTWSHPSRSSTSSALTLSPTRRTSTRLHRLAKLFLPWSLRSQNLSATLFVRGLKPVLTAPEPKAQHSAGPPSAGN